MPIAAKMVAGDDDDGTVDIVEETTDADGNTLANQLAVIEKPWATDAAGISWPATYTINGDTLTLHVDLTPTTNASGTTVSPTFPVVSDPKWKWGCWHFCGTLYLNRGETARARSKLWIAGTLFGLCTAFTAGWGITICAALSLKSVVLATRASDYYEWGGCLKIRVPSAFGEYQKKGNYNC
jgi:hypothetical protein